MRKAFYLFLLLVLIDACSSGKAALKKGDYYDAVIESVNRLRSSPDNKKAKAVLTQGYPLAIEYIDATIQNGINSDDPMKWRNAVKGYEKINYLNDQIKTSLGAMKVIAQPVTRFKELADAKPKAAEESYQDGITAMMKNTREDAKIAYFDFKDANNYEPAYRESIEMMNQAEFNATLRVAYEEINNTSINYGSLEPLINSLRRQFLSFRPVSQPDTVPPHQYLRLVFNGYRSDYRPTITSSVENLQRDIKTGEKKGPDGKTQDIMTTVTAKVTYYRKTKNATSSATMTITDAKSSAMLQNTTVEGNSSWLHEWATYSGDSRALTSNYQTLIKRSEANPNDQDLFNQAIKNLESNLSSHLQSFYRQY
jgi:hypothetical protein